MHDMIKYTQNSAAPSMHIVVFTGGEYPPPESTEVYWHTASVPDFVIAADSGLSAAEEYDAFYRGRISFRPDVILGDMDSLRDISRLETYPAGSVRRFAADKDYTDTELALEYAYALLPERRKHITLVGGDGGRIDHLLGIYDLFSTARRPSVWLCRGQALWYASDGYAFSIASLSAADPVSIVRPDGKRTGGSIVSHGLEWEYSTFRTEGVPSISNRICSAYAEEGKPVGIRIESGCFILILPLRADVTCRRPET